MFADFLVCSFILGVLAPHHSADAAEIDCDGYTVTDAAALDSAIIAQLDSASDTGFVRFSISFWWPGSYMPPDSCLNMGVTCEIPPATIDPRPYWEKWTRDLFGKYEMFVADVAGPGSGLFSIRHPGPFALPRLPEIPRFCFKDYFPGASWIP